MILVLISSAAVSSIKKPWETVFKNREKKISLGQGDCAQFMEPFAKQHVITSFRD